MAPREPPPLEPTPHIQGKAVPAPGPSAKAPPAPHQPGSLHIPKTHHLPNSHSPIRPDADLPIPSPSASPDDAERQPLLPYPAESQPHRSKSKFVYPLLLVLAVMLAGGVFVGVGGWRMGRGGYEKGDEHGTAWF